MHREEIRDYGMADLDKKLETAKKTYEERGYARIPSVFTITEVEMIWAEAYKILDNLPKSDPGVLQKRGKHPALLFWPNVLSKYIESVSKDPRLVRIVTNFLGKDTRQLNNQIYYRESGDGDEFGWHQDICFRTPEKDFDNIAERYLQTIIVVDEITDKNGPVEFIPGSHKWGERKDLVPRDDSERGLRKFVRNNMFGEKLHAKPGDVLIWSVLSVHGSEQNNSDQNRMTFMNGFCSEAGLKNKSKFPKYTVGGKIV